MIRQQMWKRLSALRASKQRKRRRQVIIISSGAEETREVDELVERWKSGEPMERFGGVYDAGRVEILRVVGVAPGEV